MSADWQSMYKLGITHISQHSSLTSHWSSLSSSWGTPRQWASYGASSPSVTPSSSSWYSYRSASLQPQQLHAPMGIQHVTILQKSTFEKGNSVPRPNWVFMLSIFRRRHREIAIILQLYKRHIYILYLTDDCTPSSDRHKIHGHNYLKDHTFHTKIIVFWAKTI